MIPCFLKKLIPGVRTNIKQGFTVMNIKVKMQLLSINKSLTSYHYIPVIMSQTNVEYITYLNIFGIYTVPGLSEKL